MGKFLKSEKQRQEEFKSGSRYISDLARVDGTYKKFKRSFCLPMENAEENLFPEIRATALAFFAEHGIRWHDGQNSKCSNHLCSSQVCCVNYLFLLADKPDILLNLLGPVYPTIRKMLPIEDGYFVTFEYIGAKNYLKARTHTRGANCTSADSAVLFERNDGKRQIVLIEWKYTESYGRTSVKIAKSGTDRTVLYRKFYEQADCPLNKALLPNFDALFFHPFYQLMRLQFLAQAVERAREKNADIVSVLHITPAVNTDFRKVTSRELRGLGDTATGVWAKLVRIPDRFHSISTEQLFRPLLEHPTSDTRAWAEYIRERYTWIQDESSVV